MTPRASHTASLRLLRQTFTVCLLGPDGAGKSTVGKRLAETLPFPVAYMYMGINPEASNVMLPTTRFYLAWKRRRGIVTHHGGPPEPSAAGARRDAKGGVRSLKSVLRLANQLSEEWFRQLVAWGHQLRGRTVLFDRHFIADYYFHDIVYDERPPISRRIHGFVLRYCYPRPDLVVCLDAPAATVHARKGEGSLEALERRRSEYLSLAAEFEKFVVIDASGSLDETVGAVSDAVLSFARERATS